MATLSLSLTLGCDGGQSGGIDPSATLLETAPAGAGENAVRDPVAPGSEAEKAILLCIPPRNDVRSTITVSGGNWGTWASCASYCPAGSFAYGFSHKSELSQGAGDDSALNGIMLNCNDRNTGAWTANVTSSTGAWGNWLGLAMCPNADSPMTQGNLQLEASQGIGDDTSANRLSGACRNGTALNPPSNTAFGTWRGWVSCPAGTAVCGMKTRVEGSQGVGDDTSLNGVQLECCTLCPAGQVACGNNGECLAPSACPPPPVVR